MIAGSARVLRLLKLLKLLKILRVVRASRLLSRWEDRLGGSYTTRAVIQFTVMIWMTTHWTACVWRLVVNFEVDEPLSVERGGGTWLHTHLVEHEQETGAELTDPADLYFVRLCVLSPPPLPPSLPCPRLLLPPLAPSSIPPAAAAIGRSRR